MGSNKLIKGKNDLLSQNSELASEWNYQRNGELKPEDVAYQSNKLVWWKCKICGYEWKSTVNNRNRGNGCPCCSNQVVVTGVNDLQTLNKDLSMEWNYEKNEGLLPENIGAGSGKKVWWKCRLCGHEWKTTVASRNNGTGCPRCRKSTQLRSFNATILRDRGSLIENNPELIEEWDYELNIGLNPEKIPSGTNKKAWWKCKTCGYKWETTIRSRTHGVGCPLCANKVAVPGKNDLESLRPDLLEEWEYTKNNVLPSMVTTGSGKKMWWRCKICGNEWKAAISARTTGTGCPECASRAQTSFPEQAIFYYIKQVYPDARNRFKEDDSKKAKELDIYIPSIRTAIEYDGSVWHSSETAKKREKNKYSYCQEKGIVLIRVKEKVGSDSQDIIGLLCDHVIYCPNHPSSIDLDIMIKELFVLLGSGESINISCDRDSIEIQALFYREIEENSLYNAHPELLPEWNYQRNKGITPKMVSAGSSRPLWWICEEGHEWRVSAANRVLFNSKCPYCQKKKVMPGFNDVASTNPEVLSAWDYEKNDISPSEIIAGNSNQKIWWTCKKGHSFNMTVYGYLGLGEDKCPICSGKRVVKGVNDLATLTPALADEWSPRNTIKPTEVTNRSNKKVWWVCNKGHEWEATIGSRNQGGGCPYCCNKKVLKGFNDLATTHPELLQEWDFEKNETKPTELTAHSGKKIWWRCPKCGYSWETPPAYRVRSKSISGCPSCVGTAVHPGFNDLETKYPQVAKHWDYPLNKDLLPSMFRPRSETEVWWNCEKGHKYKKRISMAVKLRQCPICKEEKRKLKQKKIMMD